MATESSVVETNLSDAAPSSGGRDAALATIDKMLVNGGRTPRPRGRPKKQAAEAPQAEAPPAKTPSAKKQQRPALKPKTNDVEAAMAKPEAKTRRRANLQGNPDYEPKPREYGFGDGEVIRPAEAAEGEPVRDDEHEPAPRAKTYEGIGVDDDEQEAAAPAAQTSDAEVWPAWLEQELSRHGLDKSDYTSPKAANAAIQRAIKQTAPRDQQQQQQINQPEQRKQFDPFDGYDRQELTDILGEKAATNLLARIEGIHKHYAEKFGQVEQFASHMYDHVSEAKAEKVDSIYSKLNSSDEFKGAFGDGGIGDLDETSLESSNRMRVWQAVRELQALTGAPLNQATLTRAARIAGVTVGNPKSPRDAVVVDSEIAAKLKQRANHRVGVGNSTNGHTTLSGRASGIRKIEGYLK